MNRSFLRTLVGASTLLAALTVGSATASASAEPPAGSCPAVQVRSAEVVHTTSGPGILVQGAKPHADTVLRLEAEQIDYAQAPPYWDYTVVGCGGTGPVVRTPFTTTFPAPTHPMGSCGIAVNGIELNLTDAGNCPVAI